MSEKVPRVQRWSDFLRDCQYILLIHYRPRAANANANADVLSHLPVPMEKESSECAITDPDEVEVYFAGASGVYRGKNYLDPQPQDICLVTPNRSSVLGGLKQTSSDPGVGGLANCATDLGWERMHRDAPPTTIEALEQKWAKLDEPCNNITAWQTLSADKT